MSFRTKRQLRSDIEQLRGLVRGFEAERDESTASARNAIRVLNLTPYIERSESSWGEEIYYDVNQFLEDIEVGAKLLDEREQARIQAKVVSRLGLEERITTAEKSGEVIR